MVSIGYTLNSISFYLHLDRFFPEVEFIYRLQMGRGELEIIKSDYPQSCQWLSMPI